MQDKTGTARQQTLTGFLDEIDARLLQSIDSANGGKVKIYAVNGRTFILTTSTFGGFEIYIPACEVNNTQATFDAVKKWAGI